MITCNRCGNKTPAGVLNCQVCGTPLASRNENEMSPRAAAPQQGQPALPAWLETLRAGEHPGGPGNASSSPGFSAADLLDEGALPSWMQSGRSGQQEQDSSISQDAFSPNAFAQSTPQAGLRPSSQPGPNTGDEGFPPRGIAANSLIDERSLPSWMQENKPTQQEPQSGISAASLLQSDALPEWMRSIQPQATQQAGPADSQGFSSFSSSASSFSAPTPSRPEASTQARMQQGISAGDLVDPQGLPSWMAQADNQGNAPQNSGGLPQQGNFAASSLLDSDALPPWLRQGGQDQQRNAGSPAINPPSLSQAGQNSWPPAPSPIQSSGQIPAGGIAASSFIDVNSLPGWMRSEGGMGQQNGFSGPARPGASLHGRVENMRVPNRPRNEVNPADNNSEAAANVFASMLGVASATPQYPGQPASAPLPQSGQYSAPQKPPVAPPSSSVPPAGMNSGMYGQSPANPMGMASSGYGAQAGYQSGGYQSGGYQSSQSNMAQNSGSFNNPPAGNYAMGGSSAYTSGIQGGNPNFAGVPEDQKSAKPGKRGFFDALRDLFFRSN